MTRSLRALALASASGLVLMAPWLASPALAVCNTVGLVTTCTDNSGGGPIGFNTTLDNSTVINLGTLTAEQIGVNVDTILTTVQNPGSIVAPVGIRTAANSNLLTNSGIITANTVGILVTDPISGTAFNNTALNSGTISAPGGIGILLDATGVNAATNTGTITATRGIVLNAAGNTATNNGTITALNVGIDVTGNVNSITNTGTITAPIGIRTNGATNTVVNSGLIVAAGGIGVSLTGDTSPLTNNGTITSVDTESGLVGLAVSTAGPATVTNNGVLNGGLSIGGTLINNGLIMISVPGTNTTHTAAAFQQTAAGILVLRADLAGNHDSLQVAGTATLAGTLLLNLTPRFFNSRVVFANVVTATTFGETRFGTVAVTLPPSPFIRMTTEYASPTGVVTIGAVPSGGASLAAVDDAVSVILSPVPFGSIPGLTPNQQSVGTALDGGCSSPTLGGPGLALCTGVLFAPSVAVLDILSGEIASAVQNPSFMIGEQFLDAMFNQAQRRMPCGGGQSAGGRSGRSGRWNAWASGFGSFNAHRDGDASGSARLNMSDGGGAAGVDMCAGPNLVIGFAFGGASSSFSLDGRGADGTTRAGLAGTYGAWGSGPFYVNLGLAYSRSDYSTTRNVAIGAFNERATGDFNGNQFASRLEAGFHFNFRGYSFRPFIGATGQVLRQSGFSETAINTATGQPGVTGLNTQGRTTNAPLPFMGAEASTTYQLGEWGSITPRLRLSWGHETSTGRQSTSAFQALQGASFTVNGAPAASNTANIRAGVDGDLYGLVEFYAQVDSGLAAGGNTFSASAGVRMAW